MRCRGPVSLTIFSFLFLSWVAHAAQPGGGESITEKTLQGLALRGIGPALMGGRIVDIAVSLRHRSTWYIAVGSGGVWKTQNAGTTWQPIFDEQPSYSVGCVALDPSNPDIVWVGTGENVSGVLASAHDVSGGVQFTLDDGVLVTLIGLTAALLDATYFTTH